MSSIVGRVAVVGAGLSGLACASGLAKAGFAVEVFEKSRGPGGRMATRRREGLTFDHGAQFFRVHSESFAAEVREWERRGWVALWEARFGLWTATGLQEDPDRRARWVGVPKMNSIARGLTSGLQVEWQARVIGLERVGRQWRLEFEEGPTREGFDAVVLSCPGPQAVALCAQDSAVLKRAQSLSYAPCWAVMVEFEERVPVEFDGIQGEGLLAWVARDNSKPGRSAGERWVLHASPEHSLRLLDDSPEQVAKELTAVFLERFGGTPVKAQAHRWLYALANVKQGSPFEWDSSLALGLCGDALIGGRVEAAWESGRFLAKSILRYYREKPSFGEETGL